MAFYDTLEETRLRLKPQFGCATLTSISCQKGRRGSLEIETPSWSLARFSGADLNKHFPLGIVATHRKGEWFFVVRGATER